MRCFVYPICFILLIGMLSIQNTFAVEHEQDGEIDRLRTNVLALDRVQANIHQDIALRRSTGTISVQEEGELLVFARYLQDRNRDYCGKLEQRAGHGAVVDLPCPEEQSELPASRVKTMDEEVAELDQSLAESLGAFDEMLLKEQERVAARQPRQRESGGGSGSGSVGHTGEGGAGQEGQEGRGDGKTAQSSGRQGDTTTAGPSGTGQPGQAGGSAATGDRSDQDRLGRDDDIVARQLREAAEKETDPELKEKLWQEYRKYKAGT